MKDYQLIQPQDSITAAVPPEQGEAQGAPQAQLRRYLSNFTSIISHLLQSGLDFNAPEAVEASWVLSLALKGLYNTLKVPHLTSDTTIWIGQTALISHPSLEACIWGTLRDCPPSPLCRSTAWSRPRRPSRSRA